MRAKGYYYESLFRTEALARGLQVWVPEGDHTQSDAGVWVNGTLLRVQVKGRDKLDTEHGAIVTTGCGSRHNIPYRDVDVFAVYLERDRAWWIIPWSAVRGKSGIYIGGDGGQYAKYKDNWAELGA